jgi:hypothetical protein
MSACLETEHKLLLLMIAHVSEVAAGTAEHAED